MQLSAIHRRKGVSQRLITVKEFTCMITQNSLLLKEDPVTLIARNISTLGLGLAARKKSAPQRWKKLCSRSSTSGCQKRFGPDLFKRVHRENARRTGFGISSQTFRDLNAFLEFFCKISSFEILDKYSEANPFSQLFSKFEQKNQRFHTRDYTIVKRILL